MIPSVFVILDHLPLNANGKIDRKGLPIPELGRPDLEKAYISPQTVLEKYLAEKWKEVIGIDKIGIYDDFFELGGDSLKAAVLMNKVQEELGVAAHVRALFMAPTIAELALYINEYYPEVITKIGEMNRYSETIFGNSSFDLQPQILQKEDDNNLQIGVTQEKVQLLKKIIVPLRSVTTNDSDLVNQIKNSPAVFVLSPPRSGSTLLRTMLGGHPSLFSPPELDLMSFNTLEERRSAFEGKYSFWLEGVERAVMELKNCDSDTAKIIIKNYELKGFSTKQFYKEMQNWIKSSTPDIERLLVDKTPVYALDFKILERIEHDFDEPYYIHLTRYPYASVYSFIEAKLDGVFFRYDHPFNQRELAELVWIISHENILNFLSRIPKKRQLKIRFEDLVTQPKEIMEDICNLLNIPFQSDMLKPYEGDRMTSGVRPGAQMVGDFKFYLRKDIDPKAAERWKKFHKGDFLSTITWELAKKLGYEKNIESTRAIEKLDSILPIRKIDRNDDLPLSFAQHRIWFLDQWEPKSPFYNIPLALRIKGKLNILAVERSVNEIIRRHEVLRTSFLAEDGKAVLKILPKIEIRIPVIDYSFMDESYKEIESNNLIANEIKNPFDITICPLIRAIFIKINLNDYIFVLTMHHIISDGWSVNIWIKEFIEIYTAFSNGRTSPLPELIFQYVDYAAWQREWLGGEALKQQIDYWKAKLNNIPDMIELPLDFVRPPEQSLQGITKIYDIPQDLFKNIRSFCRQHGITLFITLISAFYVLLYRYSRHEIINIGTPIANRRRSEIEQLIGFFVNTLVLQTELSDQISFLDLLGKVQTTALEAFDHQDVPFERLVDELRPEREISHTPLFQVMFSFQDAPITKVDLPDVVLQQIPTDSGTSKYDITLTMVDRGDVLKMSWEYNVDIFRPETIERMARHYEEILKGIVKGNGEEAVGKMRLMSEREEKRILEEWNETRYPITEGKTIVDLFEEQVRRSPEAIAVIAEGERGEEKISYEDLDKKSNQLGRRLKKEGVKKGEIVGLEIERSVEMIIGIMGIMKAGGAYVPIEPSYPEERIGYILKDVEEAQGKSAIIVTTGGVREKAEMKVRGEVNVREVEGEKSEGIGEEIGENDLAYVIYTSGSTGKPKGVMIEHGNAVNLWEGLRKEIYGGKERRGWKVSLNAPLLFDASVQQWLMLLSGETIVIVPGEKRMDGEGMVKWIREKEIDVIDCVPTQLKLMEKAGIFEEGEGRRPKVVLPGGEAIDKEMWGKMVKVEGMEIYNMYGPTECTVDSTMS